MSTGAISFSDEVEYYTPKHIVDMFGKFDYDPATTKEQAKYLGIEHYDTADTNGLLSDWTEYSRIWINPPFTKKKEFLKKAVDTYISSGASIYILLPISYLTTNQFHKEIGRIGGVNLYIPDGRIKFFNSNIKDARTPAFGSVIIELSDKNSMHTIKIKEV